jgi:hypothetical protein
MDLYSPLQLSGREGRPISMGDLVFDKLGNLFGATQFGGGKGTTCNQYFDGNRHRIQAKFTVKVGQPTSTARPHTPSRSPFGRIARHLQTGRAAARLGSCRALSLGIYALDESPTSGIGTSIARSLPLPESDLPRFPHRLYARKRGS